jgi:Ni/Fe-hydrogenase subunit HybB-like protein
MNAGHAISPKQKFFTPGVTVLAIISALGLSGYFYRLLAGLGAATNLTDQYPWGIWIAVDVASGVALAAGGFTTAALADIFHQGRYHQIVRPAILTAMLGYTFVVIGLLADLGRYYNVWHPLLPSMWQGNSVLFEVGMCVMIYLTVLYIEFLPIVVEKYRGGVSISKTFPAINRAFDSFLHLADDTLGRAIFFFTIGGVVLSCLHQSSLGTLMLIAPTKMHPLWYTSISPLFFLLSAIAVGFPMVIFESIVSAKSFGHRPDIPLLSSLAGYTPILLSVYFAIKIVDLTLRDVWPFVWAGTTESWLFGAELILGVLLPIAMLVTPRIRRSVTGLFTASSLVIGGVVLNRIDVFLVAYRPLYADKPYFPSTIEIMVTLGLIATLVLIYRFFVLNFPVTNHTPSETIAIGAESIAMKR